MKLHTIKGYVFGAVVGLTLGTTFLVNAGAFTAFTGMTQTWFDAVKLKLDGTYTSGKMCTSDASGTIQCITDTPSIGWGLTGNAGTTPGTDYIGTSDDQDVVFKRNNIQAGLLNTSSSNTSWGVGALNSNTTGYSNTANGKASLSLNTTGYNNTANGTAALYNNTTGYNNTANGTNSLYSNKAGSNGVAIGYSSQYYANDTITAWTNYNTSVGYESLRGGVTASLNTGNYNSAFGYSSLFSNTSGMYNTANGYQALNQNSTGGFNTANGYFALSNNTTGYYNTAGGASALARNITGSYNTAGGYGALNGNTTGHDNTAVGRSAGYATSIDLTGGNNTFLGSNTTYSSGTITNSTAVGANVLLTNSNTVILGSGANVGIGTTAPAYQLQLSLNSAAKPTANTWTIASDRRIKKDIHNFTDGLSTILALQPRTYKYNGLGGVGYDDPGTHIGIIAQEVEEVAPYMVETRKGVIDGKEVSDFKTYQGHALSFILVNAVKELKMENDTLKQKVDSLKALVCLDHPTAPVCKK